MKKYYFGLLLLFTLCTYAQESTSENQFTLARSTTFKLYPNPAIADVVYITTSKNTSKDIVVYDIFGEIVLRDRISSKSLDISRLVAGVYVLQVTEDNKTMTKKLVVK